MTLEVTESVFIQDSDRALIVLNDLRRLGVKLALDDFGTGYSSLSYLKQFPVNIVKIDRAFIADLGSEPTSRLIVSAIVRLAHSLQMTVVAEGIESDQPVRRGRGARLRLLPGLLLRPTRLGRGPRLVDGDGESA